MLCNTYMSMIHVRVEFTLFTKARFVDEVGKREELNDGLKVTEYWAVQNMHQQLKKSSMKLCQSLFRPCSQNLESFNMDWICHIGLHTARCVLGWQVENNLHWGMHTSVCGAVACRWLFPFQVFWHRGLSISLKKLNVMGVAFYNSNLCVFIPVAPGCGLLESWSMERTEGLETWDVQE